MHVRTIYNEDFYNGNYDPRDENFGFVPALIAAAPSLISTITSLFGGGRKAQFQGLAEINAAGSQAVQAMQQIAAGLASGQMPPAQAVSEAQKIVAQFNDPSIVYPAKKGKDAEARNNFISQLNSALQQIQAQAAAKAQAGGSAGGGDSIAGVSTNTLLLVGGGLLAFSLLRK